MNKTLLAIAVGGAMMATGIAAQADAQLYGSLRVQIQNYSPDEGSSTTSIADGVSRFGIRASEDLGNDLTALAHLEFRVNTASFNDGFAAEAPNNINGRLGYVGLRGAFGTVTAGTQWGTYTNFGLSVVDQFINPGPSAHSYSRYRDTHSLQWTSPDLGGVSLGAQVRMDPSRLDDDSSSKSVDDLSVGASVDLGTATLQGAINRDQNESESNWIVGVSVEAAPGLTLAAAYEDYSIGDDEGDNINAYIGYNFGSTLVHALWERNSPDEGSSENGYILGLVHSLSARTQVYVEHWSDIGSNDTSVVGLRHSF
jgi:predicted porin